MLDVQQQMLIEQRVANLKPSTGAAYLLDIFLGVFGAHRFYLKRTGSAVAMLVLTITVVGLAVTSIWAFVDLFLIPGMIQEEVDKLRQRLTREAEASAQSVRAGGVHLPAAAAGDAAPG